MRHPGCHTLRGPVTPYILHPMRVKFRWPATAAYRYTTLWCRAWNIWTSQNVWRGILLNYILFYTDLMYRIHRFMPKVAMNPRTATSSASNQFIKVIIETLVWATFKIPNIFRFASDVHQRAALACRIDPSNLAGWSDRHAALPDPSPSLKTIWLPDDGVVEITATKALHDLWPNDVKESRWNDESLETWKDDDTRTEGSYRFAGSEELGCWRKDFFTVA